MPGAPTRHPGHDSFFHDTWQDRWAGAAVLGLGLALPSGADVAESLAYPGYVGFPPLASDLFIATGILVLLVAVPILGFVARSEITLGSGVAAIALIAVSALGWASRRTAGGWQMAGLSVRVGGLLLFGGGAVLMLRMRRRSDAATGPQ